MKGILFEGQELNPKLIKSVWGEGNEIKASLNGRVIVLARYKFRDWAELGFRYLEFKLGRRASWP